MVLDKSISAGDESNVVHTDGNNNTITIYPKADKQEIEQIVKATIWDNLPVFLSVAKAQVEERINVFVNQVIAKLASLNIKFEELEARLSTPDFQYSLAESAKMFAKDPKRVDQDTLIDLITQKIEKLDDDHQEELVVIDMAISAVAKLSKNQIRWLTFLYYITSDVSFDVFGKFYDIGQVEYEQANGSFILEGNNKVNCHTIYQAYINYYYNSELEQVFYSQLSRIDVSILVSLGCIIHDISLASDSGGIIIGRELTSRKIRTRIGCYDGMSDNEQLQKFLEQINIIFSNISNIDNFRFTSVGKEIARSFLKTTDLNITYNL